MSADTASMRAPDSAGDSINRRWVRHVLRDRGLPCPDIAAIERSLRSSELVEREALRGQVRRLHMASESDQDVEAVRSWVARANSQSDQPSPASPQETVDQVESSNVHVLLPAAERRAPSQVEQRKFERSHHVYASTGAACFEPVEIPSDKDEHDMTHSIQIEMAKAVSLRRYDWDHKIIFRLTLRELPVFAAVLMGYSDFLACGNHGPSNDKFLEVREQPEQGSVFVKLKQGKRVVAVPVGAEEVFALGAMVLKVLQKNAPHLDSQTILQLVQRSGRMYSKSVGGEVEPRSRTHVPH